MSNSISFDLLKIIKNGSKYIVQEYRNPFLDIELTDDQYLIVPNMALIFRESIAKLLSVYYLHEVFELGSCYKGHYYEPFAFWHISKEPTQTIKVGIFYGDAHPEADDYHSNHTLTLPKNFTNTFLEYCKHINNWIDSHGHEPKAEPHKFEFNTISYEELDKKVVYARYYRKENEDIRKLLKSTELKPLRDVAKVKVAGIDLNSHSISIVKMLNNEEMPEYPFREERDTIKCPASTERLHKGDIVAYDDFNGFYLLNIEPDFELYGWGTIIRATNLPAEYLYLYLNSNTAHQIWNELTIPVARDGQAHLYDSTVYDLDNLSEISNFPIIVPKRPSQYYIDEFEKVSSPDTNHYSTKFDIPLNSMEDALDDEIISLIRINNNALVKKTVSEDIAELNECFKTRAYKATIILCGSILEAFLIDWLSELKNVDYFTETLTKREYNKETKSYVVDSLGKYVYKNTRADLADYIDEIRDIKSPNWSSEARKAHEIRLKRNLVHAKICIQDKDGINEAVCKKMIEYLRCITDSRWGKQGIS